MEVEMWRVLPRDRAAARAGRGAGPAEVQRRRGLPRLLQRTGIPPDHFLLRQGLLLDGLPRVCRNAR